MAKPMDIVVVGTSAGGLAALSLLLAGIPDDINAAVFIVQHTSAESSNRLAAMLQRVTALPIANASNRESIRRGRVYLAPPDHHLVLADHRVLTTKGPKENYSRPSIDPLFRSAALTYGARVIGVVLTGTLDDGSAGLWAVKERGGVTIVQDPHDAAFPQMPQNALIHVKVDYSLPITDIGPCLGSWLRRTALKQLNPP